MQFSSFQCERSSCVKSDREFFRLTFAILRNKFIYIFVPNQLSLFRDTLRKDSLKT